MSDSLQRAIQYLGAVEVEPGRYAVKDGPRLTGVATTERWYTVSAEWLKNQEDGRPARDEKPVAMPLWWTLENRVYCKACKHASPHTDQECYCNAPCLCDNCGGYEEKFADGSHPCCCDSTALYNGELVTADLTTGAEVPA